MKLFLPTTANDSKIKQKPMKGIPKCLEWTLWGIIWMMMTFSNLSDDSTSLLTEISVIHQNIPIFPGHHHFFPVNYLIYAIPVKCKWHDGDNASIPMGGHGLIQLIMQTLLCDVCCGSVNSNFATETIWENWRRLWKFNQKSYENYYLNGQSVDECDGRVCKWPLEQR